jgi:hypothetical protein
VVIQQHIVSELGTVLVVVLPVELGIVLVAVLPVELGIALVAVLAKNNSFFLYSF